MSEKIRKVIFYLSFALVFASCSDFSKIQKSNNLEEKLAAAMKYYEKKDYYKAGLLLDEITPLLKGRQDAEKAQFYHAYTYYHQKQYIMSAYYFKDFVETYPRSDRAEEAMFMYAKSLYLDSPPYNLDQTNTYDAMEALQAFVTRFPNSAYMPEANKLSDEMREKLEYKDYVNCKIYNKIGNYKSAVVAFQNFLDAYPTSKYAEEISFLQIQAQYNLAKNSVQGKKQQDRYYDVIEYYHDFIDKYPKSKYKKEAESMFDSSRQKLEQIKS
ncbi:MAG TPA: outer membrane protein assembly factor BamD [Cytophagaceae bacterium]